MSTPPVRSAVKFDLFADAARKRKIQALGDPLQLIARHIDFERLTQIIDDLLPRGDAHKGGRPPYPTAVMVRILVLKYLNQHSDEQVEYRPHELPAFCLLEDSATIPDRLRFWHYQQRLGVDGVTVLFQAVDGQLLRHGYLLQGPAIKDRGAPAGGQCVRNGAKTSRNTPCLLKKLAKLKPAVCLGQHDAENDGF